MRRGQMIVKAVREHLYKQGYEIVEPHHVYQALFNAENKDLYKWISDYLSKDYRKEEHEVKNRQK